MNPMDSLVMTDGYFEWLVSLVETPNLTIWEYSRVLNELYCTEYTWTLPMDSDRAKDGLYLRELYELEMGAIAEPFCKDCSILEMMVALARRCEIDIMGDPLGEDNTWFWFSEMLDSLGLSEYTDQYFDLDRVDQIIDIFSKSEYDFNGFGSLFVLNENSKPAQKMTIWNQLMAFLMENYPENL